MDIDPSGLVQGMERVANYDNIAISILFIISAAQGFFIYFLVKSNRDDNKAARDELLSSLKENNKTNLMVASEIAAGFSSMTTALNALEKVKYVERNK